MPTEIDATVFDDNLLIDVDGLLVAHPEDGVVSGTGGFQPFLRQNNSDGTTTGFNTDDPDATANNNSGELDMDASWTQALLLGDLPIVSIGGVAYFEIRLDLNEPNSKTDPNVILLGLTELQLYTSESQATLGDYNLATAGIRAFDDADGFNLVYDLDGGADGDVTLILTDGPSGSGNDDYAFFVPVSFFGDYDPTDYFTLYAQFGPTPPEEATFEEWRIQNTARVDGVKFNDEDGDGIRDAGEDGLEGFVMYIDANGNNVLDLGEITAESDADGAFTFYGLIAGTYVIREVLTEDDLSGAIKSQIGYDPEDYLPPEGFWSLTTGIGGDHSFTIVKQGDDLGDVTLEVGNRELVPSITIDKTASGYGDCADILGETITYTYVVTNDGDTDLTNVVVTDDFSDGVPTYVSGDDGDNVLEVGESWTYTAQHIVTQEDIDNNGNYDSSDPPDGLNDSLRNIAEVTADSEATDSTVEDTDDAVVEVCQDPAIMVVKEASGYGDCADEVGEEITYTYTVTNEGNVSLENIDLTDDLSDAAPTYVSGDDDADGELDVDETWIYTATYTVTQDDLDAGGNYDSSDPPDGIFDSLRNVAEVTGYAVTTGTEVTDDDDAVVEVCQDPLIDLEKLVSVDSTDGTDGTFTDSDTEWGDQNVNIGDPVWFKVTLDNTGNVTLTDVDVVDLNTTGGLPGVEFDLMVDGALTADAINNHGATLDGDDDGDGELDVDEVWTITYSQAFDPGNHVNTATVTTAQGATDDDPAHYFSLINEGPGVRTPGFWQNPNNGGQFWDGVEGNEKNAGADCFAEGELLYPIDSNGDDIIDAGVKGLLLGDWNLNGIEDGTEDTLFVSYDAAQILINASQKEQQDGRYMLGRDVVATWLNYLAGNEIGEIDGDANDDPKEAIQGAIDFLQTYGDTADNGILTGGNGKIVWEGAAVKTNSTAWQTGGSDLHGDLDEYNNTGWIDGVQYAHDCDDEDFAMAIHVVNLI